MHQNPPDGNNQRVKRSDLEGTRRTRSPSPPSPLLTAAAARAAAASAGLPPFVDEVFAAHSIALSTVAASTSVL